MTRRLKIVAFIALALSAVLTLMYATIGSFEPGGGGADQPTPIIQSDGGVRLTLQLNVWGGGGAIHRRYTNIILNYKNPNDSNFKSIAGRLVKTGERSEVYEFVIPSLTLQSSQPLEYNFEITLDGHKTRVPGKYALLKH